MAQPQRIVIFGKPGSGKSTFALHLAKKLKIPLLHVDKIFFVANWDYRDYEDFLTDQRSWVESENWIIDGNSILSLWMRYERATMVIYLNYPRWICYLRILKRFFYHDPEIDDMPSGCTKSITRTLLKYTWEYEDRIKPTIEWLHGLCPETPFYEITSDHELALFEKKFFNENT